MATPVPIERRPDEVTAAPPVAQQQQPPQQIRDLSQIRPVVQNIVTREQQIASRAMTEAAGVIHGAIQRGDNLALSDQWRNSQLRNLLVEG